MYEPLPYENIPNDVLFYFYKNINENKELENKITAEMTTYIYTLLGRNHFKNWIWLQEQSKYDTNIKRVLNYMSDNEWRQSYNSYYGDIVAEKLLKDFIYYSCGWWLHYTSINNPVSFPYEYWQAKLSDFKTMYKNLEEKSTPYVLDCVRITTYDQDDY